MSFSQHSTEWFDLPEDMRAEGQLFVLSDIHGSADLFASMLEVFEARSAPNLHTRLVLAGDMIDRGPQSLKVLCLAQNAGMRDGFDRVDILPGNHEAMLLEAIYGDFSVAASWVDCYGAGFARELGLDPLRTSADDLIRAIAAAAPEGLLKALDERAGHVRCGDFLIVHAGLLPEQGFVPEKQRTGFLEQPLRGYSSLHWAWIRDPFLRWTWGWSAYNAGIVIHGHTPEHMGEIASAQEIPAACDRIATHRRINLDVRACQFRNLVGLEVIEGRYRFHMIKEKSLK